MKTQEWNEENFKDHPGIFKFCFWQDGIITEVVIDDLLPCQNNQCLSLCSSYANEFWPSLLEKAYAK